MIVFLTALGEDEHQLTDSPPEPTTTSANRSKMHILVSRLKAILKRIGAGDAALTIRAASIDPARYIVKRNGENLPTAQGVRGADSC